MKATEFAPAAWVGPTQYSQMIWAVLLGYVFFGDHVDLSTLAGLMLIIGSGMLTLRREVVHATPLPPAIAASTPHVGAALLQPREQHGDREDKQVQAGVPPESVRDKTSEGAP
jgi:hypothetical protein